MHQTRAKRRSDSKMRTKRLRFAEVARNTVHGAALLSPCPLLHSEPPSNPPAPRPPPKQTKTPQLLHNVLNPRKKKKGGNFPRVSPQIPHRYFFATSTTSVSRNCAAFWNKFRHSQALSLSGRKVAHSRYLGSYIRDILNPTSEERRSLCNR